MKITELEAINAIKSNKPTSGYIILCEALDMAVNALEKQIPKRPFKKKLVLDGYVWEWVCPNCHVVKVSTEHCFCNDCGQAIDWSDHPTGVTDINVGNKTEKGGAE